MAFRLNFFDNFILDSRRLPTNVTVVNMHFVFKVKGFTSGTDSGAYRSFLHFEGKMKGSSAYTNKGKPLLSTILETFPSLISDGHVENDERELSIQIK